MLVIVVVVFRRVFHHKGVKKHREKERNVSYREIERRQTGSVWIPEYLLLLS